MRCTADIQARDGAPSALLEIIRRFPWLRHVFADGGYAGDKLKEALRRIGNLPADTAIKDVAGAIKARWICEQAHRQLKEELGLDNLEG